MPHPFELPFDRMQENLDEMVDATFSDLQSEFLVLPRGRHYIPYPQFQQAYETLKRHTNAFRKLNEEEIWSAFCEDSLAFVVLRSILGLSPPEWADIAKEERGVDVPQSVVRTMDVRARKTNPETDSRDYFAKLQARHIMHARARALASVAVEYLIEGAPEGAEDTVHRLAKVDTEKGLASLHHAAAHHVPYAMLLYERYLGRPFASHRDSVSELVGDVMENAIEERLTRASVTFRKTLRAERIPGFEQAPDFFVPDEIAPSVIIEAKITGDDGTARDRMTSRWLHASMGVASESGGRI